VKKNVSDLRNIVETVANRLRQRIRFVWPQNRTPNFQHTRLASYKGVARVLGGPSLPIEMLTHIAKN